MPLASIGLPGTSGFVGEFLALLGTFETHPGFAVFAGTGVIFAAYYMLPMTQRIWFNKLESEENRVADLSPREMVILLEGRRTASGRLSVTDSIVAL